MLKELKVTFCSVLGFALLLVFLWGSVALVIDTKGKEPIQERCPPLSVVDGHIGIKTEEGVDLLLPYPADLRRYNAHAGCGVASSIYLNYFLHKGELVPAFQPPKSIPIEEQDKLIKVVMSIVGSGNLEDRRDQHHKRVSSDLRPWRFDDPVAHNTYPLEYYPKLNWENLDGPSAESLKKDLYSPVWGVTHTQNKQVINKRNFTVFCGISIAKKEGEPLPEDRDFNPRYFQCRGHVSTSRAGKYLVANLIVSTHTKVNRKEKMKKLNLIYDAAIEKLKLAIKE